ncbi:type I polyketide synthase [Chondromyces crocatus]|uniref:Polyketide synthase n=1 Tax=Chondromyces crocatus TaxID=52 RepID=B1GYF9_CHOCO|nr:type I polyketide synthase [Chondromyces crocatus]AKT41313.1 polyketide synthase [Chondromyces crocatus]CAQ18832.1 polyketide synthase [Chondromyces crocatus]
MENDVAIIGMACRFPGAPNTARFWDNLREGVESISTFSDEALLASGVAPARLRDPAYVRAAAVLEDIDLFDASFFEISPKESELLDPQRRIFLEVAWEALEDGGVDPARFPGAIGVFAGSSVSTYLPSAIRPTRDLTLSLDALEVLMGNDKDYLATYLAYKLNLRGPCIAVQTACSTSLVAVHLACQSLLDGESDMALAGGVTVRVPQKAGYLFQEGGIFSPDGHCRTFDSSSRGTLFGSGAGLVLLKRLDRALQDGDRIRAVIKGSAINNDGARKVGFTAPGFDGQTHVLAEALAVADVEPETLSYVECHGTGTPVGDPIEIRAMAEALRGAGGQGRCAIGSVKTNFGHLESAAGVAGLIKVVLSLENEALPPSLHFREPNPDLHLGSTPFFVNTTLRPWKRGATPRRAGVNSFGIGGTNAHTVLEEAPLPEATPIATPDIKPVLLPLSARSPGALRALAQAYVERASGPLREGSIHDVARVASLRRAHHPHRLALVASNLDEAAQHLQSYLAGEVRPLMASGKNSGHRRKVVFVFPGQGSQWTGMGRELWQNELVFRRGMQDCERAMRPFVDWSIERELWASEEASLLGRVDVVQPMLFAMSVALSALWRSWGVEPDAVVGHSMGEIAAAHVAGALSLDEASRIICERSRLVQRASGRGGMAVVELSQVEAARRIEPHGGRVSIAASNSPRSTVLSGDRGALGTVLAELEREGVFCRWIKVDFASHSAQMDPLREDLLRRLGRLSPRAAAIPIYSTVTGEPTDGSGFDASYWARNLRDPVLFSGTIERLVEHGHGLFVEVSPHPILLGDVSACFPRSAREGALVAAPSLRRGDNELASMLGSLGALYASGFEVDFRKIHPGTGRWVDLPLYPWQRARYWPERPSIEGTHGSGATRREGKHPLVHSRMELAGLGRSYVAEVELDAETFPFLEDHRLDGLLVVPGTVYLEMALAAAAEGFGAEAFTIERVQFLRLLTLTEGARTVQLRATETSAQVITFEVYSRPAGPRDVSWTLHAKGTLVAGGEVVTDRSPIDAIRARLPEQIAPEDYYARLHARGLEYGPRFQGITALSRRDGEALGRIELPAGLATEERPYRTHPALLDSCLQVLPAAAQVSHATEGPNGDAFVPVGIERLQVRSPLEGTLLCHVLLRPECTPGRLEADLMIATPEGHIVAEILGFRAERIERENRTADEISGWIHDVVWRQRPLPSTGPSSKSAGTWLVLADAGGVGERLAASLGEGVVLVAVGREGGNEGIERLGPGRYRVDPARPEAMRRLFDEAFGQAPPVGVAYLWALDAPQPDGSGGLTALHRAETLGPVGVLHVVQACVQAGLRHAPRLWLVTRGAQAVGVERTPPSLAQSTLWGMARTIGLEHPELHCTTVDLDPSGSAAGVVALLEELRADTGEPHVALRDGARYVARLVRGATQEAPQRPATTSAAGERPFRLEIVEAGVLDSLAFRQATRPAPGPEEIEVRVEAAGLNFRDVLVSLGGRIDQSDEIILGGECAGTVLSVGERVQGIRVGDPVVGIAPGTFGSHVIAPAVLFAPKPARLRAEEAATIPIVFSTVLYALRHLARLGEGERVLIHAAAGGTGLAAVQIAQREGAEIFATAGSQGKREYLRGLGIRHVFDSRSLAFADELLDATSGRGVDVVLNSLAGEAAAKSLELLAPYGRFLEIGKRDIHEGAKLDLTPFAKNLAYFAVDLQGMSVDRPARLGALLREVMELIAQGVLDPLPVTHFPAVKAPEAFRLMARAGHIGKIVLTGFGPEVPIDDTRDGGPIRSDATYLITGGLGGVGLVLARGLVERGARHLALLGRSGTSPAARDALAGLEAIGASISVIEADIADPAQAQAALARIEATQPPLRGIVHGAAVLDDGILLHQDGQRLRKVMAPKVDGAWNLHTLTLGKPLDFFVLLSSTASVLGNPGQSSYAAASAFLDALSAHRRACGLPGQTINWAGWSEVGLAAAQDNRGARGAEVGLGAISPTAGEASFARLLAGGAGRWVVMPFDFRRWAQSIPRAASSPLFEELGRRQTNVTGSPVRVRLSAAPPEERLSLLEAHVREEIARVLRLAPERISTDTPLKSLGFDSLMSISLRNRLEEALGLTLSATLVWAHPTLSELVPHLADRMQIATVSAGHDDAREPQESRDRAALDAALHEVEQLSEEDALAALMKGT